MEVRVGDLGYEWIEGWARFEDSDEKRTAWTHHGVAALPDDQLVTFHPASDRLAFLSQDGIVQRSVRAPVYDAHGISVVMEAGTPIIWLADASMKQVPEADYRPPNHTEWSAVVKVSLEGVPLLTLDRPPADLYPDGEYRPTGVAVSEERLGGNGDVWVADGYGSSLVHRFNMAGDHLMSLSGEEGGGRFDTPHAVFVDRRRATPQLYIADRANGRIQVYDLDGNFMRVVGEGFLNRPTWICADDDRLIVAEFLPPRLTVLDSRDRLIGYLGENLEAPARPGWPNEFDSDGNARRASDLRDGYFNSPHTICVDSVGNFYITEWLIGGRMIKLRRML